MECPCASWRVKSTQRENRRIEGQLHFCAVRREEPITPAIVANLDMLEEFARGNYLIHNIPDLSHLNIGRYVARFVKRDLGFQTPGYPGFDFTHALDSIHGLAVGDAVAEGELFFQKRPIERVQINIGIPHSFEFLDLIVLGKQVLHDRRLGLGTGEGELQLYLDRLLATAHDKNLLLLPSVRSFCSPFGRDVFTSAAIVRLWS